jgi:mono/diheme cytochrome c family protein
MKAYHILPFGLLLLVSCDYMINQPKQRTYTPEVGPAAQPDNIVEFDHQLTAPPAVTLGLLQRGQERFRINCTPCHSELGNGHGMIVRRGFPPPPDYTIARLLNAPVQHFYDVMTNGYGAMYSFANRVQPRDRWAIAAYIRALQHARHATLDDVPADQRTSLK